jgi:hypothetical protein
MTQDNPMMAAQQPPQQQATLEDYAQGIDQVNIDLQRQSAAYGHFREVLSKIDALAANPAMPTADVGSLPFLIVRFPQKGPAPGEAKLDMNVMPAAMVCQFRPIFEALAQQAGEGLIQAWDNIHQVSAATAPIVAAAKQANG